MRCGKSLSQRELSRVGPNAARSAKPLFVGSIPTGAFFDMARVLIIDDDVTLRQALTKHLEHAAHEVRQAAEGDAGIRAYERHAADVGIADIFMPGQRGLQTIGLLCRQWPAVKVCAVF